MRNIFKAPAPAPIAAHEFIQLTNRFNYDESTLALMLYTTTRDVRRIVEAINNNKFTDIDTSKMLYKRINGVYVNVIGSDYEERAIRKLRTTLHHSAIQYRNALGKVRNDQMELDVLDKIIGGLDNA